jgi:hypothetical protein
LIAACRLVTADSVPALLFALTENSQTMLAEIQE